MRRIIQRTYLYAWVGMTLGALSLFISVCFSSAQALWTSGELDPGPAGYPVILADSQGQAHALWEHSFGEDVGDESFQAVFYARRSQDGTWTTPIDVLIPPSGGEIGDLAGVIDLHDTIHLIWRATDALYYSSVLARDADQTRAWSPPRPISRARVGASSIVLGPTGTIHIVYPEVISRPGAVFHIKSTDNGATWSLPQAVSSPSHSQVQPINAHIAVANSGRLHVVWTETIEDFPPSGVFHAFSDDQGQSWSEPQKLAGQGYSWISIGIEADDRRLHLIWTGTGEVRGKYHAMSSDAGLTWSEPELVFYGWAGYLGFSRFVLDSAGNLHLVTALGRGESEIGGEWSGEDWHSPGEIFHSVWQGDRWSPPEHVSVANWEPQLEQNFPSLAIAEGNLLLIVWGTFHLEGGAGSTWYASQRLEVPRVKTGPPPIVTPSLLSPLASPSSPPTPTIGPTPSTAALAGQPEGYELPSDAIPIGGPLNAMVISIVPSIVIVAGVIVLKLGIRR